MIGQHIKKNTVFTESVIYTGQESRAESFPKPEIGVVFQQQSAREVNKQNKSVSTFMSWGPSKL